MADFNRRFAVAPRNPADAHRAVLHDAAELDLILCEQHGRKLTKNLTIRFECREYQVTGRGKGYRLHRAAVTVCKAFDGSVTVLRDGRELPVRLLAEGEEAVPVEDEKTVRRRVDRAKAEQPFAPGLQAGAGPSLAATVPARSGRDRDRMKAARPGLGLRSLRSLRPRPTPGTPGGRVADRRPGTAKRGHFNFGEKGTFQLCVDTKSGCVDNVTGAG